MRRREVDRRHLLGEQARGVMAKLGQQEGHAIAPVTARWLCHGQIVSLMNDISIEIIQTP